MMRVAAVEGRPAADPAAWRAALGEVLPDALGQVLRGLRAELAATAVELRVRLERPLVLVARDGAHFLDAAGRVVGDPDRALHPGARLLQALVDRVCGGSVYAVGEQLRQGFVTLPGGHRVGFGGRAVLGPESSIHALTDISSACIRVARALPDVARPLLPRLLVRRRGGRPVLGSTLVLSPPGAGKTTLLRDLARLASRGVPELGLEAAQVVIVDERSELAGAFQGVPQHDVGPRTDVLDGCPKVEGIQWALRALGPEVLVTDEIGTARDAETLARAAHTGCTVVASAHAFDVARARRRPGLAPLFELGLFERLVVLSRRLGPGTVEQVSACGDGEG